MNKKQIILLGVVTAIGISSIIIINYLHEENIKVQEFNKKHLKNILKLCDYQKMMDERNWIGFDGKKITDDQPLLVPWKNSTHFIDNSVCKYTPLE